MPMLSKFFFYGTKANRLHNFSLARKNIETEIPHLCLYLTLAGSIHLVSFEG